MSILEKSGEWAAKLRELNEELTKLIEDQRENSKPILTGDFLITAAALIKLEIKCLEGADEATRRNFGDPKTN